VKGYSGFTNRGTHSGRPTTQKGPTMATTQSITITNADGIAFTVHGVPNGATLSLHTEPTPTPTVPTVAEPIAEPTAPMEPLPVPPSFDDDDTEPTAPTTVGPRGVNRSERKRTQSKPQSKSGPIKGKGADPLKGKSKRTPSAAQQAGWAKTRHGKHASVRTATEWLTLCIATEDADRIKACKAELKAGGFKVSKANKVTA